MPEHAAAAPASQSAGGSASRGMRGLAAGIRAAARGMGLAALALCVVVPSGWAQTLRVTCWSLDPVNAARTNATAANTNGIRIPAAAAALKKLAPDVILLQQVRDSAMCEELARALKPARYNVVVCSAFRDARTGALRKQQVAILAKPNAYFSWSEPWENRGVPPLPGGFAFAAFEVGTQRVGFFSVQTGAAQTSTGKKQPNGGSSALPILPLSSASAVWLAAERAATPPPARQRERLAAAYEQLFERVGSVTNWMANRVQAFVVGGTFSVAAGPARAVPDTPLQLLDEAGFADVFQDVPDMERVTMRGRAGQPGLTADYIVTQPGGLAANPNILRTAVARRFPVTCDVVLGPPAADIARTDVAEAPAPPEPQPDSAAPGAPKPERDPSSVAAPVLRSSTAEGGLRRVEPIERASAVPPAQPRERPLQAAAPEQTASAPPSAPPGRPVATAASLPLLLNLQLYLSVAALVGIVALGIMVWVLARRTRMVPLPRPALLGPGRDVPSGYTVVLGARARTDFTAVAGHAPSNPTTDMQIEPPGVTQTQAEVLRQRVLAAEQRAERATAVLRAGLVPHLRHWLKQRLARKLLADRAQLLQANQVATQRTMAVERRLARIEQQVQRQNASYQERIEALTRELLAAKEENRELIRARIAQVKADMEAARERLMTGS